MKTHPVTLDPDYPAISNERIVKTCALQAFRALRVVMSHSKEVPGLLQQAANDIRSAWEETSRPNV